MLRGHVSALMLRGYFFFLLFVSIGYTPLLSVATLGILFLLKNAKLRKSDLVGVITFFVLLSFFPIFSLFAAEEYTPGFEHLRLIICFSLLYYFIGLRFSLDFELLEKLTLYFFCFLVFAISVQKIGQFFNFHVNINESFLAQKGSGTTLDDERIAFLRNLDLLSYRPSLFYAEPSYFGLIVIGVYFLLLRLYESLKSRAWITLGAFLGCAAAGSVYLASGVILLLLAFYVSNEKSIRNGKIGLKIVNLLMISMVIVLFYFFLLGLPVIGERLRNVVDGNDASTITRLFAPFDLLKSTIFYLSPFGYPIESVYGELSLRGLIGYSEDPPLHNGLINIFISYGVLAPLVLFLLFKRSGNNLNFVFICISLQQNGAFGNWDKAFIIGLVCILSNSIVSHKRYKNAPH